MKNYIDDILYLCGALTAAVGVGLEYGLPFALIVAGGFSIFYSMAIVWATSRAA